MNTSLGPGNEQKAPNLSIIMPCYNEESVIEYTIPRLIKAFESCGYCLELVAVDNGSHDRTGEIIHDLAGQYPSIIPARVDENQGYGWGVLNGIPLCAAPWVGIIPADGQVDAEDVVRLYEAIASTDGKILGKVRRRFRMDGVRRKVVSVLYNLLVRMLWPGIASWDINGSPKILPRRAMRAMNLQSKGWLLDPEIMIKAHYMGIRILELNVFARMRGSGVSHVKPTTVWEFLRYLLRFRFSKAWQEDLAHVLVAWETPGSGSDLRGAESSTSRGVQPT
jgi:glycosyltransferase involved in cell wall biosynthesis